MARSVVFLCLSSSASFRPCEVADDCDIVTLTVIRLLEEIKITISNYFTLLTNKHKTTERQSSSWFSEENQSIIASLLLCNCVDSYEINSTKASNHLLEETLFPHHTQVIFDRLRRRWRTCGPQSIQARPAVLNFPWPTSNLCDAISKADNLIELRGFLLFSFVVCFCWWTIFIFNRFDSMTKKLCSLLTQR